MMEDSNEVIKEQDQGSTVKKDLHSCEGDTIDTIGVAKIPIGVAGPLLIHGDHINGLTSCPYATTQDSVVTSATRGATLLTKAGGVTSRVLGKTTSSRAPVFVMESIQDADKLKQWIESNIDRLRTMVSEYSSHTKLLNITTSTLGSLLYLTLIYDAGDNGPGQNTDTVASWNCYKWLMKESEEEIGVKIKGFHTAATRGDKRNSVIHLEYSRCVHVVTEAWIPDSLIRSTFNTTAVDLHAVYQHTVLSGTRIGSVGANINPANTIAAVYTATGQDLGLLGECSSANFIMEQVKPEDMQKHCPSSIVKNEGGLYVRYELPNLVLGEVGHGTGIPSQKESLQMMGCYGHGRAVYRFAEIVAGYCLSLDLSSLGSITDGTFHLARIELGKNRPDGGLWQENLDSAFFQAVIKDKGKLIEFKPFSLDTRNSILSEISKNKQVKLMGHFGYEILHETTSGEVESLKVVIKAKPTDIEICDTLNNVAQACGHALASVHDASKAITGFRHTSEREVEISALIVNILGVRRISPQIYHTVNIMEKDVHAIVMEYLDNERFSLFNTVNDISVWADRDIKVVLRDIACFHASFLSSEFNHILKSPWLEEMDGDRMVDLQPLWLALLDHAHSNFPEIWTEKCVLVLEKAIQNIPNHWKVLAEADKTLAHNDCNPRNICLRLPEPHPQTATPDDDSSASVPFSDPRTLCLYDWELCRVDVPQHDVLEFLAFVLPPETPLSRRNEFIEFYRRHLEYYTGKHYPVERFLEVYKVACIDFAINRLMLYTMVHTFNNYKFLPRVITSHMNYLISQMSY